MRFFGWVAGILGIRPSEEKKAMQALIVEEVSSQMDYTLRGPGIDLTEDKQQLKKYLTGIVTTQFKKLRSDKDSGFMERLSQMKDELKLQASGQGSTANSEASSEKLDTEGASKASTESEQGLQITPQARLLARLKEFNPQEPLSPEQKPKFSLAQRWEAPPGWEGSETGLVASKASSVKQADAQDPSSQKNNTPPISSGEALKEQVKNAQRAREDLLANDIAHAKEVAANIAAHIKAAKEKKENQLPPSTFLSNYLNRTGPELVSGMEKLVKDTEALQKATKALVGSQTRQGKDTNVDEFLSGVALNSPKEKYSAPLALTTPAPSPLGQTSALPSATSALARTSSLATTQTNNPPTRSSPTYTGVGAATETTYSIRTGNWNDSAPKKIKSDKVKPSKTPSPKTGEDTDGPYTVIGGIKYHNLIKEEEEVAAPKAKDTRTPEQIRQDNAKAIEAMKKRVEKARTDYEQFTNNQRVQEAEKEMKIKDRELVASQEPRIESARKRYFTHRTTDTYLIDTAPLSTSMQPINPDSTIRERQDQQRQSKDRLNKPKGWEAPDITKARRDNAVQHASYEAQTSQTSGARKRLLEDQENDPPGREDPHEKHYATAFPSKTESGSARILASVATNGTGVRGKNVPISRTATAWRVAVTAGAAVEGVTGALLRS